MQSIGERLEEARKRRGISVREASEGTKIRGDFLLGFENNQFDIGLPDLYVRGFLRNYAGYLKIDPDKLVTDYNAMVIGEAKASRKDSRELFGRIEIPEAKRTPQESSSGGSDGQRQRQDESASESPSQPFNPQIANYVKIGLIAVAGIVAVLVIVWLVQAIVHSASSPAPTESPAASAVAQPQVASETITLIALDTVRVKVTQVSDNKEIFDGPLAKGETRQISKNGRVLITYDVGRNLNVEKDGQRYRMPIDGYGRSSFE